MADGDPTQPQVPTAAPNQQTPATPQPTGNGFTNFLHNYAMIHTGLAARQFEAEQQQKRDQANVLTQMIMAYPEATQNQDLMNTLGKVTSKDFAQSIGQLAQARRVHQQGAQGQMSALFGGGGQQQPQAGGQGSDLDQQIQHGYQFMSHPEFAQMDPSQQKAVESYVKNLEDQKKQQAQQGQREEFHADTEADRAQSRAIQAQSHADTEAARVQAQADSKQFREASLKMEQERDDEKKAAQLENLQKGLDSSRDKILADFSKTPTPAVKARVDSYNSSASQFYKKHAAAGAPTLLKYSEEPGKIYGSTPKVEAAPPQYGTNKKTGQSGWIDADGNFYPDAGSK